MSFMSSRLFGSAAFAVASAVLVAATVPAGAKDVPGDGNASASAPAPSDRRATPTPDTRKYCFVDTVTGSRIPKKTCKTRAEWSDLGVDIPER